MELKHSQIIHRETGFFSVLVTGLQNSSVQQEINNGSQWDTLPGHKKPTLWKLNKAISLSPAYFAPGPMVQSAPSNLGSLISCDLKNFVWWLC